MAQSCLTMGQQLWRKKRTAFFAIVLSIFWRAILGDSHLAVAQQQAAAPVYSYEGQTVSSVSLAGQPDPTHLPHFELAQQPNTPYSQQKIDETVASLKNAGFQDVKVHVTPEAEGLR